MSSDRELLELAAKVAGVELIDRALGSAGYVIDGAKYWNPLTDDGDALRLAVKLRLDINAQAGDVEALEGVLRTDQRPRCFAYEPLGNDAEAATRRAIVRAAAEIGRAMP